MKNPLTLAGIEPATFRFVAQHLNHCATAVPSRSSVSYNSDNFLLEYKYLVALSKVIKWIKAAGSLTIATLFKAT